MDSRHYRILRNAHFDDVKVKVGKKEVTVTGSDQRLVMECLFNHLGDNRECWPSQLTISIWCSFTNRVQVEAYKANDKVPSLSKVKRVLKALEQNFLIQVSRKKLGNSDGRKTQNVYRFVWSNIAALNFHQGELSFNDDFYLPEYQSSTETDQSSTDQYQSSTATDQSSTGEPQNTHLEHPPITTNPNTQAKGQENLDQVREGWERRLIVSDQRCKTLIEKFQLRDRDAIQQCQEFTNDLDADDLTSRAFGRALGQSAEYIRKNDIPPGRRRLLAFQTIFKRIFDEVVYA